MPEYLHLPPAAQGVLALSAVALAIVRLLTASRPFWASTPAWLQKALPALMLAIAAIPTAIEHARSWLDVVVAFVVSASMYWTASRGDKRQPVDKDGEPRLERVNSDPKLDDTSRIGPLLVLLFLGLAVRDLGCAAKPPPCDESRLRAVDAAYLTEVGKHCLQYASAAECPELPALRAKHSVDLKAACPQ